MADPLTPTEVFIEATQDLLQVMRENGCTDWTDVEARLLKWNGGGLTDQMMQAIQTAWEMGL